MIQQMDIVYILTDVLDTNGSVMQPETTGRGTVIGWIGFDTAIVQWGSAGEYRYAHVKISDLRKYETRSHK